MSKSWRFVACLSFVLLSSALLAFAGDLQDLNFYIDTECPPATCALDPGFMGSEATGSGDFNPLGYPWAYDFRTDPALTWTYDGFNYSATFGTGGYFDITGPDGLTFTGVVTGGTSGYGGFHADVDVSFSGEWNNGILASGTVETYTDPKDGVLIDTFDIESQGSTAPEPSSFVLLGSGAVGIWGFARRRFTSC